MARREKKSKLNLKVWVPIICILIVGITFYMLHDIKGKIAKIDEDNVIDSEENKTTDEEQKMLENNLAENGINDETENTSINTDTNKNQNSAPAKPAVTDQKQKAIELVKKEWGEDNTVNYVFDYINENGEYVIAVKDKASATVKYYFRVNLETETVELD